MSSFVGRRRELTELVGIQAHTRLLTLVGAPGIGKTRLALQLAHRLTEAFPDGVWLVALASVVASNLVAQAVAAVLGISEQPGEPLVDTLAEALANRRLLLVLDNCEHVLDACAELAHHLLQRCAGLVIVATSREPLRLDGEVRWRVPPLSVPEDADAASLPALMASEAVSLFVERASAVVPELALNDTNAAAIGTICRRLDGLALAIELAAARTTALSVGEISRRLDDRFELLMRSGFPGTSQQQTLLATMDWSYALLDEAERVLMRRLAVFAGSFTLVAAEDICADEQMERPSVLGTIARLVDKSLVVVETGAEDARYHLLNTVREYAGGKLHEAGEAAVYRGRHRDWYLSFAETADRELRGPGQLVWLARLKQELGNLRAALVWSHDRAAEAEGFCRLVCALAWFWSIHGHLAEGRQWVERALTMSKDLPTGSRASLLNRGALVIVAQGDLEAAAGLLDEVLMRARHAGPDALLADSARQRAHVAAELGDTGVALALARESETAARRLGDPWEVAQCLFFLSHAHRRRGEYEQAESAGQEALAHYRRVGDQRGIAWTLHVLGVLACDRGHYDPSRYDLAFRLLEESLAQGHRLENDHFTAWAYHHLGFVAALRHDWPRASRFLCGGMLLFRDLGKWRGVACSVLGLAVVAEGLGEHGRAARLLGAADALRERTGVSWWPSHQEQFEQSRSDARGAVGEQAFAVECTVGGSLTRDAIVDLAVAVSDNMTDAPGTPPSIDRDAPDRTFAAEDLTRREREVAALIARGRTNAELARALCLSERTVEAHARNIRRKFGLVTRAQLVAWAARQFREPSQ